MPITPPRSSSPRITRSLRWRLLSIAFEQCFGIAVRSNDRSRVNVESLHDGGLIHMAQIEGKAHTGHGLEQVKALSGEGPGSRVPPQ